MQLLALPAENCLVRTANRSRQKLSPILLTGILRYPKGKPDMNTTFVEQAGTGPSRPHIQGSKKAKELPSVNLQYSKIEKPKNVDRVAHRGPQTRAPGVLKGGHF